MISFTLKCCHCNNNYTCNRKDFTRKRWDGGISEGGGIGGGRWWDKFVQIYPTIINLFIINLETFRSVFKGTVLRKGCVGYLVKLASIRRS